MNSSNAPFCNLYNRKCDFSPLRAAWHPDFFVMGLCSPLALRYAGQLQAGAQESWCLLYRALRCAPVSRCNAGGSACLLACRAQRWCAPCLAADLARPCGGSSGRVTSATICHGYRAPAYLAGAVGQTVHAEYFDGLDHERTRRVDGTAAAPPIAFRTTCVMFVPAPQGSVALRLAAAIVHVAHDGIANP